MGEDGERFEIHLQGDGGWVLGRVFDDARPAVAEAKRLMASGRHHAVRVLRSGGRRPGRPAERIVFEEEQRARKWRIDADAAARPLCRSPADIRDGPGLAALGAALRDYLDWRGITAIELVYNHGHCRRLSLYDSLLYRAIGLIAAAQARESGGSTRTRRRTLDGICRKAVRQAREACSDESLPNLEEGGLEAAIATLKETVDDETGDYLVHTAIANHLVDARDWAEKLARLVGLLGPEPSPAALGPVDAFIADLMRSARAVRDLLRDDDAQLASVLDDLARLHSGRFAPHEQQAAALADLNRLLAEGRLPASRSEIAAQIVRGLAADRPLTRGGPADEIAALYRLVGHLRDEQGRFLGDEAMWAAVESRSRRQMQPEFDTVLAAVKSPRERIGMLLDVADFTFGRESLTFILEGLGEVIDLARATQTLIVADEPVLEQLRALAGWQARVLELEPSVPAAEACAKRLDAAAFETMEAHRILDGPDGADEGVVARIERLTALCRSGAVTRGRAFEATRERILGLVQAPGFMDAYTADARTDEDRNERIRELWRILRDAGLA